MLLSKDFGRVGDSEVDSESTRSRSASEASYGSGGDVGGTRDMRLSFPDPLSSHQSDHDRAPSAPTSERAANHPDLLSSFLSDYSFVGDLSRSSSPSLPLLASVEIETTPRRLSDAATSTSSIVDQNQLETVTREPVDIDEEREAYQAGEIGKWLARTTTPPERRPTVDHAVSTADYPTPIPCSFPLPPSTATPPAAGQLDVVLVGSEELLSTMEVAVVEKISPLNFGRIVELSFEKVVAKHIDEGWTLNTPLLVVYVEDNPQPDVDSTDSLSGSATTVVPRHGWSTHEMIRGFMLFTPPLDGTLPPGEQVNGYVHSLDEFTQLDSDQLVRELGIVVRDTEAEVEEDGEGEKEISEEPSSSVWNSLGRLSSLLLVSLTAVVVIAASLLDSTPSFDHSISPIAQYSPASLTSRISSPPSESIDINFTSSIESTALATVSATVVSPSPIRKSPPSALPIRTLHAHELIEVHSAHSLATSLVRSQKPALTKYGKSIARSTPPRFISNSAGYIVQDISLVRDCRVGEEGMGGCTRLVVKENIGSDFGGMDLGTRVRNVGDDVVGVVDETLRELLLIDLPSLTNLVQSSNFFAGSTKLVARARAELVERTRLAQGGLRRISSQFDDNIISSLKNLISSQLKLQLDQVAAVDHWIVVKESELRSIAERIVLRSLGIESREEILPLLQYMHTRMSDTIVGLFRSVEEICGTLPSVQPTSSSGIEGGKRVRRGVGGIREEVKGMVRERVERAVRGREKVVGLLRRSLNSKRRSVWLSYFLSSIAELSLIAQ